MFEITRRLYSAKDIFVLLCLATLTVAAPITANCAETLTPSQKLSFDIYKELIEIDTTTATGDTARAADAMAARLRGAGFAEADLQVFSPAPKKEILSRAFAVPARAPCSAACSPRCCPGKPGELVVRSVQTDGTVWLFLRPRYRGRQVHGGHLHHHLIRFRQEGFEPDSDIIVVLETNEEILDRNAMGIRWLLKITAT